MNRNRVWKVVVTLFSAFVLLLSYSAHAQVSFSDAIRLALKNSSKMTAAKGDEFKAQENLAAMKDIFIPSVVMNAGAGTAYGPTLTLPTIFSVNAQSLVFSPQQRSYLRAAHSNLQAAQLAQDEARQEVAEDVIVTYLLMDHAQKTQSALQEQFEYAVRLVLVIQDRVNAKLDSELDLKKARRGALEIKLHQMQAEDDHEGLRSHLADLTQLPVDQCTILADTIPDMPVVAPAELSPDKPFPESPGILAVEANAEAKAQQARGDAQYAWRPQVSFGAQYGRISPIENVSKFYNINGQYNSASVGVQVQFPLFDRVRKASARQTAADAARAALDLNGLRATEEEGRRKLRQAVRELAIKSQLAELDYGIAQDDLQSVLIQLHAPAGATPITPREEQNAHIEERQKYVDLLDARRDALKAEVAYLRQSGQLGSWLQSVGITP
jgi:outer membrane protein TolC